MNAPTRPRSAPWTVLRGPVTDEQIRAVTGGLATTHHLATDHLGARAVRLTAPDRDATAVTVRWQPLPPQPPHTLGALVEPPPAVEILIDPGDDHPPHLVDELRARLEAVALPYTPTELEAIRASMPLLRRYGAPREEFGEWALIFRDHFLEHSVGFVLAMESAGIPAEWIHVLDKGDRTHNRDRVRATFLQRGYGVGLLDNTAINAPADHGAALAEAEASVEAFIGAAHAAGRRVLAVDDGGLLARGHGHDSARQRVDAALELTVSGIKRIADVAPLGIPVLNMARSRAKTQLGYREIADSCLRRLRALLPDRKFIGRPVLLLGYGTLGSRLAPALRTLGCRLTVVDTDLPTLIDAAEAGYTTYRTAGEALRATRPFLVIGTTGEKALTQEDLRHLDDGALLAPFATRDFSLLSSLGENAADRTDIPGVGTRLRLPNGRHVTLLGDGRSLNLFEADSIPNQGYDAYRAGTLIAAAHLCAHHRTLPPGLHTAPADQAIADAGLFHAYFELHLAPPAPGPRHPDTAETRAAGTRERSPVAHACVVGYGVAGRLHTAILEDLGVRLTITDPHRRDLPERHRGFTAHVDELPASVVDGIDLWSVCTPTADHLPVVRAILARRPDARVLLEKPACRAEEIDVFADLLVRHPRARVVVNDQYRHSAALPALSDLRDRMAPDAPIDRVAVTFTKDRRGDIDAGRFVDRDYGVLGYEWPHMLAVLDGVLPAPLMRDYVAGDPASSQLWATYDPELFVTALTERTTVKRHDGGSLHVDLASSILGPSILLGQAPEARTPWRRDRRPADDRHRHLTVSAGSTHFTVHFEPVTARGGWQLERNRHRLTVVRDGQRLHDDIVHDSPLETSLRHALARLTAPTTPPPPDLTGLRRIAALANALRGGAPDRHGSPRERARAVGSTS